MIDFYKLHESIFVTPYFIILKNILSFIIDLLYYIINEYLS